MNIPFVPDSLRIVTTDIYRLVRQSGSLSKGLSSRSRGGPTMQSISMPCCCEQPTLEFLRMRCQSHRRFI